MNEELLSILRSARRRLLATRAAESALAMIALSAVFAAAGRLAHLLGTWLPRTGFIVTWALVCLFLPACWLALNRRRGRRRIRAVPSVAACWIACPLAGAAVVGVDLPIWHVLPPVLVPWLGILLTAVIGAGLETSRRPGLREVAAILDAKAHLRERLSTAVELALAPADSPVAIAGNASAPVVYAQALAALKERRPQDMPFWSAPPSLPAAAGLALAVCFALAFLPDFGPSRAPIEKFSRAVATMTPAQRQELAEAFRRAASQPSAGAASAQALLKEAAAAVVVVQDPEELQRIMEKLQKLGYEPLGAVPRDILAAAGVASETPATMASSSGNDGGHVVPPVRDGNQAAAPGGYVSIYDPRYEPFARPTEGSGSPAPSPSPASHPAVPYADAWAAARARAMDAAARGAVPPAYRSLVRDYFAAEE